MYVNGREESRNTPGSVYALMIHELLLPVLTLHVDVVKPKYHSLQRSTSSCKDIKLNVFLSCGYL